MEYYQCYESGTTYLLEIDHNKKLYSIGSFRGKPKRGTRFCNIDITAYGEHIRKINKDYQCLNNKIGEQNVN